MLAQQHRVQHLHWLLGHAGASISFLVLAAYLFERGLRRYASGNSLLVRT